MRGTQLLAGVDTPVLPAQPLPVQEVGAAEFHAQPGAGEPAERLAVQSLGRLVIADQRSRAGLDAERPVTPAGAGAVREPLEGAERPLGYPTAGRCLNHLGRRPR